MPREYCRYVFSIKEKKIIEDKLHAVLKNIRLTGREYDVQLKQIHN